MSEQERVRVVVVGCGGMARTWVRIAIEHPQIELAGLVDIRREAAEAMAEANQLPASLVFDTLGEAIEQGRPDAVFDVTVPAAHDKVTIEALRAGCHVLGEKPMSDSIEKAQRMVATAKEVGRSYVVAQTRRPNPDVFRVAKLLQSGAIGDVEEIYADFFIGAHFGGFRDEMDDVLLVDMAIHTFDQARQITDADPVSVYCHAFNPKRSWYRGNANAQAIFEMRGPAGDEIVFNYRGSWCAEGLNTDWNAAWRIVGSKGTLTWNGGDAIAAQALNPQGEHKFFSEMQDLQVPDAHLPHTGHEGVIYRFVEHLLHDAEPYSPCQDNIKSLAMVLWAVQSGRERCKLDVTW